MGRALLAITLAVGPAVGLAWPLWKAADRVMPNPSQLRRRQLDEIADRDRVHR